MGSQCNSDRTGVMWSKPDCWATTRARVFWTSWRRARLETDVPARRELQSSREPTIADAIVLAASIVREDRMWRNARMWKYDALQISDTCDPLTKLNNKILRILQNRKLNYPVPNLYRANNTLPLLQLHNYFILILLHKFKFNRTELPAPFLEYFKENYTIHSHNTRQIKNLHVDRTNTTLGQRSVKFKGVKLWNDIPSSIKLFRNKYTFKRKLKLYLMNI